MTDLEKLYRQVKSLKQQYPKGTMIRLHSMNNEPDMPEGLVGWVTHVDDIGQIHMAWENGRSLPLVASEDSFQVVSRPKTRDDPCR